MTCQAMFIGSWSASANEPRPFILHGLLWAWLAVSMATVHNAAQLNSYTNFRQLSWCLMILFNLRASQLCRNRLKRRRQSVQNRHQKAARSGYFLKLKRNKTRSSHSILDWTQRREICKMETIWQQLRLGPREHLQERDCWKSRRERIK